jgi:hypothetical protein
MPHAVFMPPHPDLTRERLALLARIILDVWSSVVRDHNPDAGDGEMVFGVQIFERCLNKVRAAALANDDAWLRSLVDRLHYVFTVGAVPLRVFKGKISKLKGRYRRRRDEEQKAHHGAFKLYKDVDDICFRVVIEETTPAAEAGKTTSKPARTARVALVKYSLNTGSPLEAWDLTTFEAIVVPVQMDLPLEREAPKRAKNAPAKPESIMPPGVVVKKPRVRARRKPKEDSGTDDI